MKKVLIAVTMVIATMACTTQKSENKSKAPKSYFAVSQESFGKLESGEELSLFRLKSPTGMEVGVTNFGAIITHWTAPDKNGKYEDIVLGFENVEGYLEAGSFYGAVVGRYGNRIALGKFSLDGVDYELATNNEPNHLHGGVKGFDKVVWTAKEFATDSSAGIVLTYLSKDMEEGYPGNLTSQVTYTLDGENGLTIDYLATTDKATVVNLTQHSYFNLSGNLKSDILGHDLQINADSYTPVNKDLIPTGIEPVAGTPLDFTATTSIGARINEDHIQLKNGMGYDHNWVLNPNEGDGLNLAAVLSESVSGRKMEVWTSEPGIQFYSGNFMNAETIGKGGKVYDYRHGLCLETQHYPDSPNQPEFPSTVLRPGEEYRTTTVYRFSVLD